jgi:hypothetical protein
MIRELRTRGFPAGKERVERLMRENGIHARHKRRYTGCRSLTICSTETSHRRRRIKSGLLTSPTCGPTKAGCTLPLCSISLTAKS